MNTTPRAEANKGKGRDRQQPGTGLGGSSPSRAQRRILAKLEKRVNGFTDERGRNRPGSQNPHKQV